MKKYLVVLALFFSGCAFMSASTTFDPVAHLLITHAALDISRIEGACGTPTSVSVVDSAVGSLGQALRYSSSRPSEQYISDSLTIVNNQLSSLRTTIQSSTTAYCQIKAGIMTDEMRKIEQASGERK